MPLSSPLLSLLPEEEEEEDELDRFTIPAGLKSINAENNFVASHHFNLVSL
jgi:hypothetical protein